MIVFFIVLSFWLPTGQLVRQTSNEIPTIEACEKLLAYDIKQRVEAHGNATGKCIASPVRPAGLPEPKVKRGPASV